MSSIEEHHGCEAPSDAIGIYRTYSLPKEARMSQTDAKARPAIVTDQHLEFLEDAMKLVERVRFGSRGQGSLILLEGSRNWISCYFAHGKEHRESTGTDDLKKAKRFHKQKLDEIGADRQGLRKFLGPVAQRVRIGELLDELEADYRLRKIKSWASFQSHVKPIREHFGLWLAVEITADAIDAYIEERLEAEKSPA